MRSTTRAGAAITLVVLASAAGCAASDADVPPKNDAEPKLVAAEDLDPDPNTLHVALEAKESTTSYGGATPTPVWAYNGHLPGPLLDAKVGDRLVVELKNSLPEPTTIHWHGLRLPAAMDGTMAMQQAVQPGGSFRYTFTFKDAGLYWYHPHVRSDIQVHKGLYGAIRVRGPNEPVVDDERVFVLDDIAIKDDGSIRETLDDNSRMMGREGNVLLVNGKPNAIFEARAGGLLRLRVVNAANGRFFNLRLEGHRWRVIGHDGGLLAQPYDAERVLVAPGERYDLLVVPQGPRGATFALVNEPYERGHHSGSRPPMTVAQLRIADGEALTGRVLPAAFPGVAPLPEAGATPMPIALDEVVRDGEVVFTINGKTFPDVPEVMVPNGALRVLEVSNASEMDHPFHLHGFFFQVLSRNGAAVDLASMGNKDTIVVPALGNLRLLARFDEPGHWMYHCHILEHAELGMMGAIHVE